MTNLDTVFRAAFSTTYLVIKRYMFIQVKSGTYFTGLVLIKFLNYFLLYK